MKPRDFSDDIAENIANQYWALAQNPDRDHLLSLLALAAKDGYLLGFGAGASAAGVTL